MNARTTMTGAAVSGPPLIPRRVLFGNPDRVSPALSPDGRRLAWIAPHGGVLNVWVRDLHAAAGTERVITHDRDRGVQTYAWAPDGRRILFGWDEAGDENWRLADVHLDTGVLRELTPKGCQARIVKIAKRWPGQILVGLNMDNPQLHDVYRLDLADASLTKVCANPGFIGFVADEDLKVRAALAPASGGGGGTVLLVRDTPDAPWRALLRVDEQDALSTDPLAFNPAGDRLLCITSDGANAARLVWFDLVDGARTVVVGDDTYDVAGAALHVDTNEPRVAYLHRERLTPVLIDPTVGHDLAVLGGLGGDLELLGSDHTDRVWLLATDHDDGPTRYYTYQRATATPTLLFTHRPELEQHTLATMEPFTIRSRDGLELHGYLTSPPGRARRNLPAVLLVHGGPWHRDSWGFDPQVQWLTNRGYLVLQVNYRGSTGY